MKQLKIGIVGSSVGENSWGVGKTYLNFIENLECKPQILCPMIKGEIDETIDALLLPGGMDLNPANYNDKPGYFTTNQDVFKQYFFDNNLSEYIKADIPVIGICLGFQQLAAFFGSKINQNLNDEHCQDRSGKGHPLFTVVGKEITNKKLLKNNVNSHHHQGVYLDDLSNELLATSASDDLVVESFIHKKLPIVAYQWHPEEILDDYSYDQIIDLLNYAIEYKKNKNIGSFIEKLYFKQNK